MVITPGSVTLAGSPVHCSHHVCAFFNSAEQEFELLLPFIREGIEQQDKIFHILDKERRPECLRLIGESGIDVEAAEKSGQLEVCAWEQVHLRRRKFDQHAMLELVDTVLSSGQQNFGRTRFWANMEWSLTQFPGVEDLVEYECRLNSITSKFDDVVVCAYDLKRFSAAVIIDILRTHPQVIIGGILQENQFYAPPDEFLRELQSRKNTHA